MNDIERSNEVDTTVARERLHRWVDEANIFQFGFHQVGVCIG